MLILPRLSQVLLGTVLLCLIWNQMADCTPTAAKPQSQQPSFQDWILTTPLPQNPQYSKIELRTLPLFPDLKLAEQLDTDFTTRVADLNDNIARKQRQLHRMLQDWSVSENVIRLTQKELSQLRTERDRLALEHLLIMRQLERNIVIPIPDFAIPQAIETP
ncbi:MAG: hypothetical protein HC921_12380 [Synechococcaceae cyanobacterium SM2_3_1]|nr:hypothetical protein [Synechococcaceae cyanobacterium SM2_3_1]